jgi:PPOX class probable F420-dependent enzyme
VDPELLRNLLAEARVGHLATVAADGKPHVVPVCFVLERDSVYWVVDHKPKASRRLRRLANIRVRPVAQLVVDHYAEDWVELWWVRVSADAAILEPGPEAEHALDLLATKYEQYRERRPDGPVVRLAVRRWSGWSAADQPPIKGLTGPTVGG